MSKSPDIHLLIPASRGWQLWSATGGKSFEQRKSEDFPTAAGVANVPKMGLTMAFPVRKATALPFRTKTTDAELHQELAELHAEQLGFRPETGAGKLFDVFNVSEGEDGVILLPVVLTPPEEGSMPLRSPEAFEVSARLFSIPDGAVAVWQELGRWVFAIGRGSEVLYFQGLTEGVLDGPAATEIQLAVAQLNLQGCQPNIREAIIWTEGGETFLAPDDFVNTLGLPVGTAKKPDPRLPSVRSTLLPEDVVAARSEKARKRNLNLAIAAVGVAVIGLVGFSIWQLMQAEKEAEMARAELQELGPDALALSEHIAKWDELEPVVDQESWPVELLYRTVRALPKNGRGLRLEEAAVDNRVITLKGDAEQQDSVSSFDLQLRRSALLGDYEWETPAPTQAKNGRWRFIFTGTPADLLAAEEF